MKGGATHARTWAAGPDSGFSSMFHIMRAARVLRVSLLAIFKGTSLSCLHGWTLDLTVKSREAPGTSTGYNVANRLLGSGFWTLSCRDGFLSFFGSTSVTIAADITVSLDCRFPHTCGSCSVGEFGGRQGETGNVTDWRLWNETAVEAGPASTVPRSGGLESGSAPELQDLMLERLLRGTLLPNEKLAFRGRQLGLGAEKEDIALLVRPQPSCCVRLSSFRLIACNSFLSSSTKLVAECCSTNAAPSASVVVGPPQSRISEWRCCLSPCAPGSIFGSSLMGALPAEAGWSQAANACTPRGLCMPVAVVVWEDEAGDWTQMAAT
eukprot:CAMPEP_0172667312 /NCGR_PEP_ID=MMETSP1074-20121228/8337_1 /TAXON_ID=2916 /ORGANISM="Ceratium fusus, Strain PA161109" /LENGTH=322 /DNA_ID=CAMNT_0013483793 /DNA_START=923 /DNA_END=1891 /DNA_ORIENTATION=-